MRVGVTWICAASFGFAVVDAPQFLPVEGDSATKVSVTVTCATLGAVIHYTVSGAEPTIYDPVVASGSPVEVKRGLTLKAKAFVGAEASSTASSEFRITGGVVAGGRHILLLKEKGDVFAWGHQNTGRLGNGSSSDSNLLTAPVPSKSGATSPLVNMIGVAAGFGHSVVAERPDVSSTIGYVWAYGNNAEGEIGNNTSGNEYSYAVRVLKSSSTTDYLQDCIQVSAGRVFSAALAENGQVYTWGAIGDGRLGRVVATADRKFAGLVRTSASTDLTGIVEIDLGMEHAVVREANAFEQSGANGYVWAWGCNDNGQVGNGTTVNNVPSNPYATKVKLNASTFLTDAWDVSAGNDHTAVVRWKTGDANLQGSVWTFGANEHGRLGNNNATSGPQAYPVQVVRYDTSTSSYIPLQGIVQVSAGAKFTLARTEDGKVWAWGNNEFGQLGTNSTANTIPFAVQVKDPAGTGFLTGIVDIAAGGLYDTSEFSVALKDDGTVYAWGSNTSSQLNNGSSSGKYLLPVVVGTIKSLPNYPTISLASSVTQVNAPGAATLTATVADADGVGTIQKVEFYLQGVLHSTQTGSPWTASLTSLSAGDKHTYAVITDTDGNVTYSLPATFTINNNLDTDNDGLLDSWEMQWFGNLSQTATGDPDGDKVTNAQEATLGTNPTTATDSDADGMPDDWEQYRFGGTSQTGSGDADGDGVSNAQEWTNNSNPVISVDSDVDGLPDDWENHWFGNLDQAGSGDADSDKVTNAQEYALASNPTTATDGDSDGMPDDWERHWFGNLDQAGSGDADSDKVSNAQEYTLNTNPTSAADTDSDGLPDDWERLWFAMHTSQIGTGDADGDKVSNAQEWALNSNPTSAADSDSDDMPDDWERYRFSGSLSQSGSGDPDGDKVANVQEYSLNTNPTSAVDSDSDDMPDDWERYRFGDLTQTGGGDVDLDKVSNAQEYVLNTNPTSAADGDSDGLPDDWETFWFSNLSQTGSGDYDRDMTTNAQEFAQGSDPVHAADTDADGMADGWEIYYFSGLQAAPLDDPDHDGVPNIREHLAGTNPTTTTDSDSDGLGDDWEIRWFGNLGQNDQGNPDGDGTNNLAEYTQRTSPIIALADTDSDSLADDWEMEWIGNLNSGANDDPDGDKISNASEFANRTNPSSAQDSDSDGLPDDWEIRWFTNLTQSGSGDPDNDGATNAQEYAANTDPTTPPNVDTDNDGLPDAWEMEHFSNLNQNGSGDPDGDGYTNAQEYAMGTNPNGVTDVDFDGLADEWERYFVGDITSQSGSTDYDGDGKTNAQEIAAGTKLEKADTDGDGILDGVDDDPLTPDAQTPATATTLVVWTTLE